MTPAPAEARVPSVYFSENYPQARVAFLDACTAAGARISGHRHPTVTAPDGSPLFTDLARFGPASPDRLVVISSGTHGVEGFCGSGCQTGLVREGLAARLPADTGVLLVHALNPYGFAHLRRVNEDNIDLNRNFVDHDRPHPDSSAYAAVHALVAPADLGDRREDWAARTRTWIAEHGLATFQAAVTGGQYAYPDGLFYGGQVPSWSNRTWRRIIHEEMTTAHEVRLIDVHTGLGPFGHGEKLGLGATAAVRRAREIWGPDVTDLQAGASVSAVVSGDVGLPLFEILEAAGVSASGIALEYGTRQPVTVLAALQLDNWLCIHGDPASAQGAEIKRALLDAFYPGGPERDDWTSMVFRQAVEATDRALAG